MENEKIQFGSYTVNYYSLNTLIIGSGAAALNAAVSLYSMGQKDILVVTAGFGSGTSNNAGSDKQTFYKLSLCGDIPDSVVGMAGDLFKGKCMHGDIALCEAQGSVRAFMNLVNLGVPFPHDKYGSWAGYKTDNDPRARATSAGPYTSRMMFSALSDEVKKMGIKVLDSHYVTTLFTDRKKGKAIGALAVDTAVTEPNRSFVLFNATNIILGTGGPGDLYEESVYPHSQTGSIGMALKAGASAQNLTESQFGIASLKFRWNLSGSYQQVIPRYFSTDENGDDEKEFLNDIFPDYTSLTNAVFLKGYQWPFDVSKIAEYGSSMIDLLVYREKKKGRRIFIDFRNNFSWKGSRSFLPSRLNQVVFSYLSNSGALMERPVERLKALNSEAVNLYAEHGIDLSSEPLEVGICAQHCNGGLKGNIWWESDLMHLFPVGEVNGSHGVCRPGGSALNSGQVGSLRAATFIARRYKSPPVDKKEFLAEISDELLKQFEKAGVWLRNNDDKGNDRIFKSIRKRMSDSAGIIRNLSRITDSCHEAKLQVQKIDELLSAPAVRELAECFMISNNALTQEFYLEAIKAYLERGGRGRGSFIVGDEGLQDDLVPGVDYPLPELCNYDRDAEEFIVEVRYSEGNIITKLVRAREIPVQNLWFEKVWKDYLEDNFADC